MSKKVVPHTQNAITISATNKPGDNEALMMSQKGVTENFVEEAPKDGKKYARQDGKWVEITA